MFLIDMSIIPMAAGLHAATPVACLFTRNIYVLTLYITHILLDVEV